MTVSMIVHIYHFPWQFCFICAGQGCRAHGSNGPAKERFRNDPAVDKRHLIRNSDIKNNTRVENSPTQQCVLKQLIKCCSFLWINSAPQSQGPLCGPCREPHSKKPKPIPYYIRAWYPINYAWRKVDSMSVVNAAACPNPLSTQTKEDPAENCIWITIL